MNGLKVAATSIPYNEIELPDEESRLLKNTILLIYSRSNCTIERGMCNLTRLLPSLGPDGVRQLLEADRADFIHKFDFHKQAVRLV